MQASRTVGEATAASTGCGGWGRVRRAIAIVAICLGPLTTGACTSLQSLQGPPPSSDIDKDIADLQARYGDGSISAYYANKPETVDKRNEFITGRLTLINLRYLQFIQQFSVDSATFDTALDITKLGLDIAGTATGAVGTKTVLAAIASGITGSRLSIDKNFLDQKTAGALVTTMNAERKVALIPILEGLKTTNLGDYPLTTAIVDLDNYYYVGTLPGALNAIQADAGVSDANAQKTIDQLRQVPFKPDQNTSRIFAWIWPNATIGADGAPMGADGKPATANAANVTKLKSWLAGNGLAGVPIATFMNSGDLASARAKAVSDSTLTIP